MAVVNQWGKRSSTDVPVAEPEAQRRRLDANDSSSNSSSGMPSVTSRALPLSPFEELSGDVVQHLFLQMDRRTQGVMAQCSKLFSSIVQQSRWDQAGSLVENGKLRLLKSNDCDVRLRRGTEKSLFGEVEVWWQLCEKPKPVQTTMTDHDIGFWLGCNYPHISLNETATPELMAGLSTASGWRSLSLRTDLSQYDLPTLLEPLIDGLGLNTSMGPRELFLVILDQKESSLVVPEALWNSRLELVGLDFGEVRNLQQTILQFERAITLRYLGIVTYDDQPTADVLNTIGTRFPELQCFQLISNESKWPKDKNSLAAFQRDHPLLQTFTLFFGDLDPSDLRVEFPVLNVRHFCLKSIRFIDINEKFSEWVATNKILEELNIEVDDFDTNEGADFRKFAQAVGVNQSLRTLSVGGYSEIAFETLDEKFPYQQCLVDLVEGISHNACLAKLTLEFYFNDFAESKHSSKWHIVKHLESLEAVNPGLILEIVDPSIRKGIQSKVFGAGITVNSALIEIPANEFVARFGWSVTEQMPGPEESVLFQVDMPTWGNGAFRKMIGHLSMRDKDKKKLILEGLSDGSLAKESIQVLGIVPTEDSQEEELSDSDEDR